MTIEDIEEILPRNKRLFLMASNIIVAGTIVLDLLSITNIIFPPLDIFTLYNLAVLGVALYSYQIKKHVNIELAKRKNLEEDSADVDDEA
ncbi:hypothetical protein DRO31_05665 [Candidatus Bathyarchaeota archaeon]|nr:MAG: hypothetical protein DRO31_05665 [Candidatus Bathyarchaeota archaeon]